MALDRVDLGGDLGQDGRGIARAGADLEDLLAARSAKASVIKATM